MIKKSFSVSIKSSTGFPIFPIASESIFFFKKISSNHEQTVDLPLVPVINIALDLFFSKKI